LLLCACCEQKLQEHGLPTPTFAIVNRSHENEELDFFAEEEDYIVISGNKIRKPFVEKPVDGEPQ